MKEEKELLNKLNSLQETEKALDCEIKEAEKEQKTLIKEEHRLWKEYSKHQWDYTLIEDKQKR